MMTQSHLQPINFRHTSVSSDSDFSLFPKLPKELRTKIWLCALCRQRIINIHINTNRGLSAAQAGEIPDCNNNGERYFIVIYGRQLLSKFLRVNSKSREAALKFHRVHLPCRFNDGVRKVAYPSLGTFHFNTESDSLFIQAQWPAKDTIFAFFY